MIPLAAALSRRLMARRTLSAFCSVPIVATAPFTRVFSSLLTALLRSARLALVRLRFFWLLMLATSSSCSSAADRLEEATRAAARSHGAGRRSVSGRHALPPTLRSPQTLGSGAGEAREAGDEDLDDELAVEVAAAAEVEVRGGEQVDRPADRCPTEAAGLVQRLARRVAGLD